MLIEVVGVFILGMCTLVLIAAVEQMNEGDCEAGSAKAKEDDKDGKK